MKTNIFNLLFLFLTLTACQDYLEEENPGNRVADEFYNTSDGYLSLVNSTFSTFRTVYGRNPYVFSAGTDMYALGRGDIEPLMVYDILAPSNPHVTDFYADLYSSIQLANTALAYQETTEQIEGLDLIAAEIRFIRAHYYFLLVQTFGGVPLVTERIQETRLEFPRESAERIYEFVIEEMEAALAVVPEAAELDGRIDKRAIRHFLAKVYLTRGYKDFSPASQQDFEMAASLADAAINGQTLNLPFGEVFEPGNEENEEVLFAVEYDRASLSNLNSGGHFQNAFFGPYMGGTENVRTPYRHYQLLPTWYLYSTYNPGDIRFEETFMLEVNYFRDPVTGEQLGGYYDFYTAEDPSQLYVGFYFPKPWEVADTAAWRAAQPELRGEANIIPPDEDTWLARSGSQLDFITPAVKKFDDPSSVFGSPTSTRDIFIARLAETYLIAAEAYLMANDIGTAVARINEVRVRSGAEPITEARLSGNNLSINPENNKGIHFILDERARELVGEYHRWFDLSRTGTLVERASLYNPDIEEESFASQGEIKLLRPIPSNAIVLNEALEPEDQNPGY